LAIVWAVQTLRHYLEGRRFRVRTDHRALSWIRTDHRALSWIRTDHRVLSWIFGAASSDNARLARYRLKLAGIDFVVSHLPGLQNRAADGMPRCGTDRESPERRDGTEYDESPCVLVQELPPRTGPLLESVKDWNAITTDEMRAAEEAEVDCVRMRGQMASPGSALDEDGDGLLVRVSPLDSRGAARLEGARTLADKLSA
jgi:RNase H-like domain found in reverse transcriptase